MATVTWVGGSEGIGPGSRVGIDQEFQVRFRFPVRFTQGVFRPGNPLLRGIVDDGARALAVIDEGLLKARPSLAGEVTAYFAAHSGALDLVAPPLVLPGGEAIKNRSAPVDEIRAAIDRHHIDRHSFVLAIGGGALLDSVGYAAATAHRGVRLVRVPTTVLAQNDSASASRTASTPSARRTSSARSRRPSR